MSADRPGAVALRFAAVDCGTNTVRLLVAEGVPGSGVFTDVHRETRTVRLGEGVDASGTITTAALDRAWSALAHYAAVVQSCGVVDLRVAATSAVRDARNPDAFRGLVRDVLHTDVEILDGDSEAVLGFVGTASGLPPGTGRLLTVDIGGGSTELVLGNAPTVDAAGAQRPAEPLYAGSVDVGAVRVTERWLPSDPPTSAEIDAARAQCTDRIAAELDRWPGTAFAGVERVIAVAGTAMTVAAGALRHPRLDPALLDGALVPVADLRDAADRLLHAHRAHRAMMGYVLPGRVDVIGGGALVLQCVLDGLGRRGADGPVAISVRDVLDGLVLELLDRTGPRASDGPA